jgi:hypothetical protein
VDNLTDHAISNALDNASQSVSSWIGAKAAAASKVLIDSVVKSGTKETRTLYHYSNSQTWRGSVLPEGRFLTDNPSMGSKEARSKLALPNIGPGEPLYVYPVQISEGQVTPVHVVDPMKNNITKRTLKGGGNEYVNLVPLPMEPVGVPAGP